MSFDTSFVGWSCFKVKLWPKMCFFRGKMTPVRRQSWGFLPWINITYLGVTFQRARSWPNLMAQILPGQPKSLGKRSYEEISLKVRMAWRRWNQTIKHENAIFSVNICPTDTDQLSRSIRNWVEMGLEHWIMTLGHWKVKIWKETCY